LPTFSSASFNVAVKHLFRHLHEPHLLRSNPLVRHVFENLRGAGLGGVYERAALDRVHELVRLGAVYCRDADIAAGREERAARQHAIIMEQCLEQRPMREVAEALGISYYHCYRQRAEICRRVARYICERDDAPALDALPEFDEFASLADRAMQRAACSSAEAAFREGDALVRAAASAQQRIEALRVGALIAARFGDVKRAERARREAQALWSQHLATGPSPSREIARACIELMDAKLAYHRANPSQALAMARRATERLAPIQDEPRVRQLYGESLYELGAACWNLGDFERGYEHVADAEAHFTRLRLASPHLRIRVMVEIWQMRNYLLMNSKSWYPSWQRRKGLIAAFEQAYAAGAFFEAATALAALAEHHAFAGNDDETLRTARAAVSLAKQEPSERLRAQISIQVAMLLLWTRHWDRARSFLPVTQRLDACDTYHRELAAYFAAERAFRRRAFRDAWNLTRDDSGNYVGLGVRKRLIAAASAHELEHRRTAGALLEATLAAAERLRSVPLLRDTYSFAGQITGNSRYKRQAVELTRLLNA
jgi:hypothetical protein